MTCSSCNGVGECRINQLERDLQASKIARDQLEQQLGYANVAGTLLCAEADAAKKESEQKLEKLRTQLADWIKRFELERSHRELLAAGVRAWKDWCENCGLLPLEACTCDGINRGANVLKAMDAIYAAGLLGEPVKPVETIEWNKMSLEECHAFCLKHDKWVFGRSNCGMFEFWHRGRVDANGQAHIDVSFGEPIPLTLEEAQNLPAGWTIEKKTADIRSTYAHYTLTATRRIDAVLSRSVFAEADSELLCAWRLKVACLVNDKQVRLLPAPLKYPESPDS